MLKISTNQSSHVTELRFSEIQRSVNYAGIFFYRIGSRYLFFSRPPKFLLKFHFSSEAFCSRLAKLERSCSKYGPSGFSDFWLPKKGKEAGFFGLVMAPRTSLERLPSNKDSYAVSQVRREWLVSPFWVRSHARAVKNNIGETRVSSYIAKARNVTSNLL